jgi:hypothetical protein
VVVGHILSTAGDPLFTRLLKNERDLIFTGKRCPPHALKRNSMSTLLLSMGSVYKDAKF